MLHWIETSYKKEYYEDKIMHFYLKYFPVPTKFYIAF